MADLQEYCEAQYNKRLTIAIGQDERQPLLAEEFCPLIVISTAARQISQSLLRKGAELRLGVCILEKGEPEKTGNQISFPGTSRLDQICDLVNEAILSATTPDLAYTLDPSPSPEDEIARPFYKAWIGFVIEYDSTILEE
jgi:hypothetical protein